MAIKTWIAWLATESGFGTIAHSCRNTKILCLQRFVRLFAYGTSFLILAHFLSGLGFSDKQTGLFMTLTLLGDTVISFLLTAVTDQVGRRRVLAIGAALMTASGVVFSLSDNYWILTLASIVGVISPSGNEIGPFRAVEESILSQLSEKNSRSDIFAWYTLFGTAGTAIGTLLSGWMVQLLQDELSWSEMSAYRAVFLTYAALGMVKLCLVFFLTDNIEPEPPQADHQAVSHPTNGEEERLLSSESSVGEQDLTSHKKPTLWERIRTLFPYITPVSRSILYRLLLLFCLDSFASGLASPSWLTYFFTSVHSLRPGLLGTLFLVTNILATLSNLAALPLARRIGPLKTMVFTHLPSAIFLAMVAVPPPGSFGTWLATGFLALRACTQSMDQAPRQAFISAAVLPSERTAVLGVVNTVKTLAQAGGIGSAGVLVSENLWILVFVGAGAMKASYDLLMLGVFLNLRDREE